MVKPISLYRANNTHKITYAVWYEYIIAVPISHTRTSLSRSVLAPSIYLHASKSSIA